MGTNNFLYNFPSLQYFITKKNLQLRIQISRGEWYLMDKIFLNLTVYFKKKTVCDSLHLTVWYVPYVIWDNIPLGTEH